MLFVPHLIDVGNVEMGILRAHSTKNAPEGEVVRRANKTDVAL